MNDPPVTAAAATVRLERVTLRVQRRTLLCDVTAEFAPGKLTLIVGPSGVGKTLLLRMLAGLITDEEGDVVHYRGQVVCKAPGQDDHPRVGVVFQHFALFDEWTPEQNVQFALAHRRVPPPDEDEAPYWLRQLGVPADRPTAALSGGQRQRLAIARSLAFRPQVMLYDEPTSGLDPVTAQSTVQLLREMHRQHRATTIIVTHDYDVLLPIADAVWLLDPLKQTLVEIPREQWNELPRLLPSAEEVHQVQEQQAEASPSRGKRLRATLGRFLERSGTAVERALLLPWSLLPRWSSIRWGLRYLCYYLALVAGPTALLYLAVAGLILGFVATYFTFRFLPYAQYTEPLLMENLVQAIGFLLYRVLAPALATLLIAARCGAAVAADIGGKSYAQQLDAMRCLGASPQRYLHTGVLWAFLLASPLLVGLLFWVAKQTSMAVFAAIRPQWGAFFWQQHFHLWLQDPAHWWYRGTPWWLAKVLACAAGTGTIAYHLAARVKLSSRDISRGITATILWSTLWVLLVHMLFAFFEFES